MGHHRKTHDNHLLIGFGYSNDKHSNRSAGCALLIGKPFAEKHIHSILAPTKQSGLRGRAGVVTIKYGSCSLAIILAYFPPRPWESKDEPKWRTTCRALREWVLRHWDDTRTRITPFIMTDLNSQLEYKMEHPMFVGQHGGGRMNENGQAMAKDLIERNAAAINTHFDAGPTYVNRENAGKTIDFLFAPAAALDNVSECKTWRRRTRAVAASPYVVDHIALVATIFLGQVTPSVTTSISHGTETSLQRS